MTESLPLPAGGLLSRRCTSSRINGRLLAEIYTREGKRKEYFFFYKKGEIMLTDTIQGKLLMHTSTSCLREHKMPRSAQESAGRELPAAGMAVPW